MNLLIYSISHIYRYIINVYNYCMHLYNPIPVYILSGIMRMLPAKPSEMSLATPMRSRMQMPLL